MAQNNQDPYADAFQPGSDYLSEHQHTLHWLVEGFLPLGYLAILGGVSKCGKSCLATALAVAVARNQPFLGMPTRAANAPMRPPEPPRDPIIIVGGRRDGLVERPMRVNSSPPSAPPSPPSVLWCAYEESHSERTQALHAFGEIPANLLITHERPLIDTHAGLRLIQHWVRKTNARLIVIDPLYGAVQANTLAHGPTARAALDGLKRLCEEEQCTALVLHHLNKSAMGRDRFAESHQLLAAASMDILMESAELSRAVARPSSPQKPHSRSGRVGDPDLSGEPGWAIGNPAVDQSSNGMAWAIQLSCKGRGDFANRTLSLILRSPAHYEIANLIPTEPTHAFTVTSTILECLRAACDQGNPPARGGSASEANRGGSPSTHDTRHSTPGLTCRQIAAATGMNLATVRVRMWTLVRSGRVVAKGKRGRTYVYSLPELEPIGRSAELSPHKVGGH